MKNILARFRSLYTRMKYSANMQRRRLLGRCKLWLLSQLDKEAALAQLARRNDNLERCVALHAPVLNRKQRRGFVRRIVRHVAEREGLPVKVHQLTKAYTTLVSGMLRREQLTEEQANFRRMLGGVVKEYNWPQVQLMQLDPAAANAGGGNG